MKQVKDRIVLTDIHQYDVMSEITADIISPNGEKRQKSWVLIRDNASVFKESENSYIRATAYKKILKNMNEKELSAVSDKLDGKDFSGCSAAYMFNDEVIKRNSVFYKIPHKIKNKLLGKGASR